MKELRIRKIPKGWICEIKKGFIFKKWIPFIKYNGLDSPFEYSSKERCISDLKNYLKENETFKLYVIYQ